LGVVPALFCLGNDVSAAPIPTDVKNVFALQEAMVTSTSMLVQILDLQVSSLAYSGTFTDAGWNGTLTGTYGNTPLMLSFIGMFNTITQQGTFTSSGQLGSGTWTGNGNWSAQDESDDSTVVVWDSGAFVPGIPLSPPRKGPFPDKHLERWLITRTQTPSGPAYHDVGVIDDTLGGDRIGRSTTQLSDAIFIPADNSITSTVNVGEDGIYLSGSASFATGTVSGRINVVPEPASMTLFCVAIAGVFGYKLLTCPQRPW